MAEGGQNQSKSAAKLFPIFQKNYRPVKQADPLQEIQMTLERSQQLQQHQSRKRKCLLGKKETPGLTQMILDAGQKEIGPVFCEECGLLYSPGDIEDEREHQKAHARLDNLFSFRLWKDANIIQNFPAEGCMVILVDCKTDSKRILNSLKDFLAWLDSEVGASHDESGNKPSERIFLYAFRTKRKNILRVLGCAIVETIDKEQVITSPLVPENCLIEDNGNITLGLTRLWCDSSFRRRNIASRLCDAIRVSWSLPGIVLSKNKLGILEPSDDGRAFMSKYTHNQGLYYTYNRLD